MMASFKRRFKIAPALLAIVFIFVQMMVPGVAMGASNETDIISFTLEEQTGPAVIDADNHTVTVEVANGTDVTSLTPTIVVSDGATISPASGVAQDFTNPVTYTVTAEDGVTTQDWTVTVTVAEPPASSGTDIISFTLEEQTGPAVIDADNHTVTVEVANGTDVTSLTPTIVVSDGATISPASGVAQDFTNPVTYTVTAEDGVTRQDWTVTVTVAEPPASSGTDIISFTLEEQTGPAVIDADNHTVTVEVANGTDVTSLTPTIVVSDGATISPASGVAQDFTNPVTYTVTAEDGVTRQDWTVTVTVAEPPASSGTDIISFTLEEQTGPAVIDADNHTVTVEVANGTDVTSLTPTIVVSDGATISPASGVAQDFTNPVTYTVTAEDGVTRQDWTVTVTVAEPPASSGTDIISFTLEEQTGPAVIDADNHTVTVEVANGTDVTSLTPTIVVSDGATISPASGVAQDFTNPVTYTVFAGDGVTTQDWTVTVIHPITMSAEIRNYNMIVTSTVFPGSLSNVDPSYLVDGKLEFISNDSLAGVKLERWFYTGQRWIETEYTLSGDETSVWLSSFTGYPYSQNDIKLCDMAGKTLQSELYIFNAEGRTFSLKTSIVAAKAGEFDSNNAIVLYESQPITLSIPPYAFDAATGVSMNGLEATVNAVINQKYAETENPPTLIFQLMDGNAPVQQIALSNVCVGQQVSAIFNLPEDKEYTCKVLIWDSLTGQVAQAAPMEVSINAD